MSADIHRHYNHPQHDSYAEVMLLLSSLLESKTVIPQIDSEFDLYTQALEAVGRQESGRATGKVILRCI